MGWDWILIHHVQQPKSLTVTNKRASIKDLNAGENLVNTNHGFRIRTKQKDKGRKVKNTTLEWQILLFSLIQSTTQRLLDHSVINIPDTVKMWQYRSHKANCWYLLLSILPIGLHSVICKDLFFLWHTQPTDILISSLWFALLLM